MEMKETKAKPKLTKNASEFHQQLQLYKKKKKKRIPILIFILNMTETDIKATNTMLKKQIISKKNRIVFENLRNFLALLLILLRQAAGDEELIK